MNDPLRGLSCLIAGHCWVPRHTNRGFIHECFQCGATRYITERKAS